jgi:lactoylglutathione lyase
MVRISDVDASLHFYCDLLDLELVKTIKSEKGRFTNYFLCTQLDKERYEATRSPALELTYNWDLETYSGSRNFGHLAYRVDDIYGLCEKLIAAGVTINRPPRDGNMAFVKSPDGISIELLQEGEPLAPAEPWQSMSNTGSW